MLYWFCSYAMYTIQYTCIYAYKYILTFVFVVGVCLYFPSGHGRLSLLSPQLQYINRRPPQPAGHRGMQQRACLRQGDPASAFKATDFRRLQDWRTASPIPRPQENRYQAKQIILSRQYKDGWVEAFPTRIARAGQLCLYYKTDAGYKRKYIVNHLQPSTQTQIQI